MPRQLFTLAVAAAIIATAGGAMGQIEVEADDAADAAAEAAAVVADAEAQRSAVLGDLVAAMANWQDTVAAQTALSFEVADLRSLITSKEARASQLKDVVRARVVDSYMAGGVSALPTLLNADSLTDLATAQIVFESMGRQADADIEALEVEQIELVELRARLAAEEGSLSSRTDALEVLVDELDILFSEIESEVASSHEALLAADSEYREAFELLQQMTALQRATGRGVERWRPIVEHYFPSERVEQALEVMWCESRGNPKATHPLSDASGLFQFMEQTWGFVSPRAGFEGVSRYDPEANIASAAWLLEFTIERGHALGDWGRWSCQPTSALP